MKRRIIWCLGLCVCAASACERYSDEAENLSDSPTAVSPKAAPQEKRVEEMPAKSEDPVQPQREGKTAEAQSRAMHVLQKLQNEALGLRQDISAIETAIDSAPDSSAWREKLMAVESLVRDAETKVGALENVRNLPQYGDELGEARVATRVARASVEKLRTELKNDVGMRSGKNPAGQDVKSASP